MTERPEGGDGATRPWLTGQRGRVENTIEIEARPEAVFDCCTDILHEPERNPKLLEVEKLTTGPIGLATRFRMRFDGMGWSTSENVAFHRPRFWAAKSTSTRLDARFEGEVTPTGRGTRLTVRTQLLPNGVLSLAPPRLQRKLNRRGRRGANSARAGK
jgi:hypothetical protein